MITPADFLTLPYTPDLTSAGITYACRSLAYTFDRMGGSRFKRLRRIVAGVGVELAFRRHLSGADIPFDVLGATHFTQPDRYDVALGGRRCDLKSYMLTRKKQIHNLRREPSLLLEAPALVPYDQIASDRMRDDGLYVFAFLTALTTSSQVELARAQRSGQPVFLIHPLPQKWARPDNWHPLGDLVMKSEHDDPVEVEVGGQDGARGFRCETVCLPSRQRTPLQQNFYTVNYFHSMNSFERRIGIHSPILGETHVVSSHEWGNIWVYGMEIILVGYITRGEFRRRSQRVMKGSRVFQYRCTRTLNLALPVKELHPMDDLFTRVVDWAQAR